MAENSKMAADKHEYFCLWVLDSCLLLASHMTKNSFIELRDLKNMDIAVGIAQLYCV